MRAFLFLVPNMLRTWLRDLYWMVGVMLIACTLMRTRRCVIPQHLICDKYVLIGIVSELLQCVEIEFLDLFKKFLWDIEHSTKNVQVGSQTIEWDVEHSTLDPECLRSVWKCFFFFLNPGHLNPVERP